MNIETIKKKSKLFRKPKQTNLSLILKILISQGVIAEEIIPHDIKEHQIGFVIDRGNNLEDWIFVDMKEDDEGERLTMSSNNEVLFMSDYKVLSNPVCAITSVIGGL